MFVTTKDPNLFLLFGGVGLLLFGSLVYGIYTTVGPSSHKLRDTIQEHARMHEEELPMTTMVTITMKQNISIKTYR